MDVVPGEAHTPTSRCEKGHEQQQAKVCCQGCDPMQGNSARTRPVTLPGPGSRCGSPCPSVLTRRSAAPSPRGGSRRTPTLPRHPGASGLGTALERLGVTPGAGGSAHPQGKARVRTAEPPRTTLREGSQLCALRATAAKPDTATRMWHGICSPPACIFPQLYICILGRTSFEDS